MAAIWELVRDAETRNLGLPEIQRKYRWGKPQAAKLAYSLYNGYPIGGLTMWKPNDGYPVTSRLEADHGRQPDTWVIDGASRITTMCTLFGTTPYWAPAADYKVQFNPKTQLFRCVAPAIAGVSAETDPKRGKGRPPEWVDVHAVLAGNETTIQNLVENIPCGPEEQMRIMSRLMKLHAVRNRTISVDYCNIELEDAAEVFELLNAQGAKVSVAEIALALAASRNPGFVAGSVQPFLDHMAGRSFALDPTLLLRSLAAIWQRTIVFRDIKPDQWGHASEPNRELTAAWSQVTRSWTEVAQYLGTFGIHRIEDLPGRNALLPLAVIRALWPQALESDRAFKWMLRAIRCGHYAASSSKVLADDLLALLAVQQQGGDASAALDALDARLSISDSDAFLAEEFTTATLTHRELRFFLYTLWVSRGARDWVTGEQLRFRGNDAGNPEWHHIFPKEHLSQHGVDKLRRNLLANICLMEPKTNRDFSCDAPATYLAKAGVTDRAAAGLTEQLVPTDARLLSTPAYEEFLAHRASRLASSMNEFLGI